MGLAQHGKRLWAPLGMVLKGNAKMRFANLEHFSRDSSPCAKDLPRYVMGIWTRLDLSPVDWKLLSSITSWHLVPLVGFHPHPFGYFWVPESGLLWF